MRNQPLASSSTATAEQSSAFRHRVQLSRTLRGVLDEVPDSVASLDDIGHSVRPVTALVLLIDPESLRHPEQEMVVGPTPLGELEDPLEPNCGPSAATALSQPSAESPDLPRRPLTIPPVREREEKTIPGEASGS